MTEPALRRIPPVDTVYTAAKPGHAVVLVPENIPNELKTYDHWVIHRDKEPYDPKTGKHASTTDSRTWGSFSEAIEALETGTWTGVGFVFASCDPYVGIDLDKCRDPETGVIEEWAQEILRSFENAAHVEVSPSGTGIHLITRGVLKEGINTKHIEVYGQDRFFTITGVAL
jgi:putative DNA primase/helicase